MERAEKGGKLVGGRLFVYFASSASPSSATPSSSVMGALMFDLLLCDISPP